MARNRDPFSRALSSLRERIQSGELPGGSPVIVQDEALRLRLSTTPVREALARLSGEGLVERAASGGYVTLRLDATTARERYALQGEYVRMAFELNRAALGAVRPPAPGFKPGSPSSALGNLFSAIVCSAGNQALWFAFERISSQLKLVGRFECELFDDLEAEALALHVAYTSGTCEAFLDAVVTFHSRRAAAAAALAALAIVRRGDPTPVASSEQGPTVPLLSGRLG